VIYKVGTDNIITEATNRLSARLKSKYGEDSVVLVTKNKDSLFNAFLKSLTRFAPQVLEAAPQQFNSKTLASFA
jgi:hypothetical protein